MAKNYHLFISHSWAYPHAYEGLLNLLDRDASFDYTNYSVPKDDPIHTNGTDAELYAAIKEQISHSSAVLILAGIYASYSRWIQKEIQIAQTEFYVPKPIIAVEYWGAERTSSVVKNAADKIVKWNSKSIIDAIKELG